MNQTMKQLYFKRALLSKKRRPPKRLPRQLFPERVEAQYLRELTGILDFVHAKINARIKPLLPGLVAHYGRVRKDEALEVEKPLKYYTAFIYEKTNAADVLHCTHHYLGELNRDQLNRLEILIDTYFLKGRDLPRESFEQIEFFGPDKDVRVLTPVLPDLSKFFPDLKAQLEAFRPDDFPEYKPHVSTPDQVTIDRPFSNYALISKLGIHRTWPKSLKLDADDLADLADQLEKVRLETSQEYSPDEVKTLAKLTGKAVADFNAAQMGNQLKGIAEIDLFGGESWLSREMGAFVVQNVGLISSISDEYLDQVGKMISTSIRGGLRVEEIAADLEDRFDVSKSRAALIARDQVGKFNGQLTELRQKDLGVEKYIRRGVGDARERDSHLLLNNQTFSWDDPPDVGHPGEDYQCRCWAEPVLTDFYGEGGADDSDSSEDEDS